MSYNNATAVLLEGAGHGCSVLNSFFLTAEAEMDSASRLSWLISQTAKKTSEMSLKYDEITVSLDCSMYAQHNLQSEFSDHKQIEATIAFDAEEAVATDANELAVTFNITGKNQLGANVTVFTSKRGLMYSILDEFKAASIDPIFIEPDVVCLSRYLNSNMTAEIDQNTLTVVVASNMCYLVTPAIESFAPCIRSFLIYPNQDIVPVLKRQIPITVAAHTPHIEDDITKVVLVGNVENIDTEALEQTTGLNVTTASVPDFSDVSDKTQITDYAIAYGTAMPELVKSNVADFRKSFMPFEGKIRMMQKSIRLLTVYLTVLMVAVGIYFQAKVIRVQSALSQVENRIKEEYSDVMFGKKPNTQENVSTQLRKVALKLKASGSGLNVGDEKSVPAQLTYLLQAINSVPSSVSLEIADISISARSITIVGNTKSRRESLSLSNAINKHPKLKKGKEVFKNKAGTGDTFTISAELK